MISLNLNIPKVKTVSTVSNHQERELVDPNELEVKSERYRSKSSQRDSFEKELSGLGFVQQETKKPTNNKWIHPLVSSVIVCCHNDTFEVRLWCASPHYSLKRQVYRTGVSWLNLLRDLK